MEVSCVSMVTSVQRSGNRLVWSLLLNSRCRHQLQNTRIIYSIQINYEQLACVFSSRLGVVLSTYPWLPCQVLAKSQHFSHWAKRERSQIVGERSSFSLFCHVVVILSLKVAWIRARGYGRRLTISSYYWLVSKQNFEVITCELRFNCRQMSLINLY